MVAGKRSPLLCLSLLCTVAFLNLFQTRPAGFVRMTQNNYRAITEGFLPAGAKSAPAGKWKN